MRTKSHIGETVKHKGMWTALHLQMKTTSEYLTKSNSHPYFKQM